MRQDVGSPGRLPSGTTRSTASGNREGQQSEINQQRMDENENRPVQAPADNPDPQ